MCQRAEGERAEEDQRDEADRAAGIGRLEQRDQTVDHGLGLLARHDLADPTAHDDEEALAIDEAREQRARE
ncbi:hypothetical protein D3C83_95200 [compost metagenome]